MKKYFDKVEAAEAEQAADKKSEKKDDKKPKKEKAVSEYKYTPPAPGQKKGMRAACGAAVTTLQTRRARCRRATTPRKWRTRGTRGGRPMFARMAGIARAHLQQGFFKPEYIEVAAWPTAAPLTPRSTMPSCRVMMRRRRSRL